VNGASGWKAVSAQTTAPWKLLRADLSGLENLVQRARTELLVARDHDGWLVVGVLQREMAALAPLDTPALAVEGLDRLIT